MPEIPSAKLLCEATALHGAKVLCVRRNTLDPRVSADGPNLPSWVVDRPFSSFRV